MTTEEKKRLGHAITRLSPEDINKALEIIAQNDPTFQATGETVEVDIDAQVFRHCLSFHIGIMFCFRTFKSVKFIFLQIFRPTWPKCGK